MRATTCAFGLAAVVASFIGCGGHEHATATRDAGGGGSGGATSAGTGGTSASGGAKASANAGKASAGSGGSANASGGANASASGGAKAAGGGSGSGGRGAGGAGRGGAGGESAGDGSSAAGAGALACASGNVCDDFESYKGAGGFGAWKQQGNSGTLTADGMHVWSGAQAVHFHIDAGANKRVQLERTGAPLFPAKDNAFWGRVMVYASALPGMSDTENKDVHYDVIQASGSEPGEYRIAGMGHVLLNYEPHDCYFNTNKVIPEDHWTCWEWLYDGTKNVIEFYIDGAQQARLESKGNGCVDGTDSVWDAPTFNALRIGFVNYQSKAEVTDLWMDDFAAGSSRIGCPSGGAGH